MNIDEMLAGQELDVLVAQEVMQRTLDGVEWRDKQGMLKAHAKYIPSLRLMLWKPSTDIATAWPVWEQLPRRTSKGKIITWHLVDASPGHQPGYRYLIKGIQDKKVKQLVYADTVELAICRAALRATREASSTR